jgi:O-antigen/teichoic acid export membrane protein
MPASVTSTAVYFLAISVTVVFHWNVTGVGMSLLVMRLVDFLVRFFPTVRRVLAWEAAEAYPPGLRKRMIDFTRAGVLSMIVSMIVWGRSEIVLLKWLCGDIRQVSFYSLAFTMSDQLLLGATVFGGAAGATIFAQYGRDKSRLPAITASTFRYLALTSIPLHFIAASLAAPALLVVYGSKFQDAVLVVTIAPLMCMFKAFANPAQNLLQSWERQRYVIGATVLAGAVDIGVAWYFIRGYGALGASYGNGAAQATAVGIMWFAAIYLYHVKLPWVQVAKIAFGSAIASLAAHVIATFTIRWTAPYTDRMVASHLPHFLVSHTAQIASRLAPLPGILAGGCAALLVLLGLFYLLRVLEPEDRDRFHILTRMLPKPVAASVNKALSVLIRPQFGAIAPDNAL